jgi:hypothetical protein
MQNKLRDTICALVVERCVEEYLKTRKIPNVSYELVRILDSNSLAIVVPETSADLVYRASQAFQNFILEQQTASIMQKYAPVAPIEIIARVESTGKNDVAPTMLRPQRQLR